MPFSAGSSASSPAALSSVPFSAFSASSASSSSASSLSSPHFGPWPPCHPPTSSNFDGSLFYWDFGLIATPQIPPSSATNMAFDQQCKVSITPPPSTSTPMKFGPTTAKFDGGTSALKTAKRTKKRGESRRYKTPSPQLLRVRRESANARERKRMYLLNKAYEKLRAVLRPMANGQSLSKFDTLRTAYFHIISLNNLLKGGETVTSPAFPVPESPSE